MNGSGNFDLSTTNRPTVVAIAHHNSNYLHTEDNNISNAWVGPFDPIQQYWLYWDFNPLTFIRTFGATSLEPVSQSIPPGSGDATIVGVIPGLAGIGTFIVNEHYVLPIGKPFNVTNSSVNNGVYTVDSATFDETNGTTAIVVTTEITDSTIDGSVTLDVDSLGNVLDQPGRHWYNTTTNVHYVRQDQQWVEVLRVFATQVVNGTTLIPQSINGTFTGTQIGDTSSSFAGRVIFDENSKPIRRDNRTFFTTEDQFFAGATRVDAIRLESNVARAQFPFENSVAEFSVVAWKSDGKAQTAQYDDAGTTIVGMLTESVLINEIGAVIIQGIISNNDWNWTTGSNPVAVGTPLWISNGMLTTIDPHVLDVLTYPIGRVPVARILDDITVIFEQGLGGKGDAGPSGSIENIPVALTSDTGVTGIGGVTLTVPSSIPELAIVPSDQDPRLSDARIPLPHLHNAVDVSFVSGAGINSNNTEGALLELGTNKVSKSGDTMQGLLTLSSNPTSELHAATKNYVDTLVSGLVWLDPICIVSLISDTLSTPPQEPNYSDAYIIPIGSGGAWTAITVGNVVVWDGTVWLDRGSILDINPDGARLGISMTSSKVATGSFSGRDNSIAIYDVTGTLVGFETPQLNNAVFVCSDSSLHAYNQYAFNTSEWVLFGGGSTLTADNDTISQTGNILSTKQYSVGGSIDAKFIQGQELSDLDIRYAPFTHTHTGLVVTINPYVTSLNWGTPSNITNTQLNSNNAQTALQELLDEKALKTPLYANLVDLPLPATVVGMVVHVTNEGKSFVATAVGWIELAFNDGSVQNHSHQIPYDISYFVNGSLLPTEIVGSFISARNISLDVNAPGSLAVVAIAPTGPNVTVSIKQNTSIIGTITFATGSTSGVIDIPLAVSLLPGDLLQLESSAAATDPNMANMTVVIVGCSVTVGC